MSDQVFRLPDVGEGLTEAEILQWLVQPGDQVDVNEMLVEIETAKAAVELPSPFRGTVRAIHVQPGELVAVGTPIITITVSEREAVLVGYGAHDAGIRRRRRIASSTPHTGTVRAKPLVRKLARERGIDLGSVTPTGRHGEVTRADLDGLGSRIAVRGVQRAMAEAMTTSASNAPQATIWLDVDMSEAYARLEVMRSDLRITPLALVSAAVIEATREYPVLNASWTPDGHIQVHDHVHLGIAVDSPRGLLVPSVKDAQSLDVRTLAEAMNELVETARSGRCTPEQLTGSTITITNVGVFGVDGGTPLLNPGEAAIIGMGRIQERPWVVNGNLVVRPVMTVMMTFDHRIIDGATGSKALTWIAAALQRPQGETFSAGRTRSTSSGSPTA
jgi:2-oxoisovalerate dehydrogenase E2 component (dihydrolipoyl transacylase)